MRILQASSELHPYSKSGGLADMVGALAKALAAEGHQVGVVTPLYRGIREKFPALRPFDWRCELPLGDDLITASLWTLEPAPNLIIYFVDCPAFFDRAGLYNVMQAGHLVDHPDNAARFIFYSKVVVHLARYLPWRPEVLHVHDWQAGLAPLFIRHQTQRDGWLMPPRSVLTIHNLAYQGVFPAEAWSLTNLPPDYFHPTGAEFYGQLNCLKAGLEFADQLTTVSQRYAREITTPEYGSGLDGVLRRRHALLEGILNGVDYGEWNTEDNPALPFRYSVDNLIGKERGKAALQAEVGLPVRADVPLFATITRLADQKGMDLQLGALEEMSAADLQFVLLGSGSPALEKAFLGLARRHSRKVAVRVGFDQALSHRIEAGSDFYLMPSRFEPCGLNQLYSLRYGTVPVVRRTGGLDDSVVDVSDNSELADGIKFQAPTSRALAKAIRKALVLWEHPELLAQYRDNGMRADFSWERTCLDYVRLYERVVLPR